MTKAKPTTAAPPDLAVPRIEGQPYHPDPDVMAKVTGLTDLNTAVQTDAADPFVVTEMDGQEEWIRANAPIPEADLGGNRYEKTTTDFGVAGGWGDRTPAEDRTTNPYLLESSAILGELAHEAVRARAVIQQLDAEIDHLNQDAAFQIRRIEARRDIELEQRNRRKDDLMKIVAADTIINGSRQESGE